MVRLTPTMPVPCLFLNLLVILSGHVAVTLGDGSGPNLQRQNAKRWREIEEVLAKELRASTRSFLQGQEKEFQVPVEIDIFLVGFGGEGSYAYKIQPDRLEELLTSSLSQHCPAVWDTGSRSVVCASIHYQIIMVDDQGQLLSQLESQITKHWSNQGQSYDPSQGYVPLYSVEAEHLEPVLNEYLDRVYADKGVDANTRKEMWHAHNAIFVINPHKRRMSPVEEVKVESNPASPSTLYRSPDFLQLWRTNKVELKPLFDEEGRFAYRYTYGGTGAGVTWVSRENYVVIDVSAGPVSYGPIASRAGSVSPASLPRLEDVLYWTLVEVQNLTVGTYLSHSIDEAHQALHAVFLGHLTAVITSAVQYVFVPDIRMEQIEHSKRVLVPVVVLHDHDPDDPAHHNHLLFNIDEAAVRQALEQLVDKEQEPLVLVDHHYLHAHPQINVALHKAMHSQAQAVIERAHDAYGTIHLQSNVYIDSSVLIEEFHMAVDMLTAGLISQITEEEGWTWEDRIRKPIHHLGTRVVPVYVLSLKNPPENVVLNNRDLVVASHDAVVVLQLLQSNKFSAEDEQFSGHVVEDTRLMVHTRDPTRQIIAGIAAALVGLTPPYQRYDVLQKRFVYDWLWGVGASPFGPYSNFSGLSGIQVATAQRNILMALLETVVREVQHHQYKVDKFVEEHFTGPFPGLEHPNKRQHWLDVAATVRHGYNNSLSPDVVQRLESNITIIEQVLVDLAIHMELHRFGDALDTLRRLVPVSLDFCTMVNQDLEAAVHTMQCCALRHKMDHANMVFIIVLCVVLVGALFGVALWSVGTRPRPTPSRVGGYGRPGKGYAGNYRLPT